MGAEDPKAWVLVPVDPTTQMVGAATRVDFDNEDEVAMTINLWHAMLSATPHHIPDAGEMVSAPEAFSVWWNADGRFLDPDTSDVPWFDKREALAEYAYLAAADATEPRVLSLEEEVKRLRQIVSKCAAALPNGAFIHPELASIEFMEMLPGEIASVCAALKENGNG